MVMSIAVCKLNVHRFKKGDRFSYLIYSSYAGDFYAVTIPDNDDVDLENVIYLTDSEFKKYFYDLNEIRKLKLEKLNKNV